MAGSFKYALDASQPGASLALWLALHHPDLFVTMAKKAAGQSRAAAVKAKALGRLGDDTPVDAPPLDTGFDPSASSYTSAAGQGWGADALPSATSLDTATLATIPDGLTTVDTTVELPPSTVVDDSPTVAQVADQPTSAGSSVGSTLASAGSSVLGALGSVAKALTSPAGITALAGAATAYFKYQGTVSTNQTQQAVLATQLQRAQAGQTAAPITYITGANGQQIPVIATPNGQGGYTYAPLTSAGLANLTPASLSAFLSQYGLWLALGAGALLLLSRR